MEGQNLLKIGEIQKKRQPIFYFSMWVGSRLDSETQSWDVYDVSYASASRLREYIPLNPLTRFGFFSCLD